MSGRKRTILLVGGCGSGKTWVMKRLIKRFGLKIKAKLGMFVFQTDEKIAVMGNYNGSMFEGSDKLSMAVMRDCSMLKEFQNKRDMTIVCEGDRFTNSTFIKAFDPFIIKIMNDGSEGRQLRGSNQSARHIQAIQTRVDNTIHNYEVLDSLEALKIISAFHTSDLIWKE
tara:strand:+ start:53 stop:559 length:507 start_codon:yes stop_codon:yes gene_type:complete